MKEDQLRAGGAALVATLTAREFVMHELRHWDLVLENEPDDDEDDLPAAGMKPTGEGIAFPRRRLCVQHHVGVCNGKPPSFEGDLISIDQLPEFNYHEIRGGDDADFV